MCECECAARLAEIERRLAAMERRLPPLPAQGWAPAPAAGPPLIHDVLRKVSAVTRVSVDTLQGRDRSQGVVRARALFCLLAKRLAGASQPETAFLLNKDPSTICSALRTAKRLYETDELFGYYAREVVRILGRPAAVLEDL